MPMIMTNCGTKNRLEEMIELDDFAEPSDTAANEEDRQRALILLEAEMSSVLFASGGFRNNCAVNCCIALHVLGYDAKEWLTHWCNEQENCNPDRFWSNDLRLFLDHVKRVSDYLSIWGPANLEWRALDFVLDW